MTGSDKTLVLKNMPQIQHTVAEEVTDDTYAILNLLEQELCSLVQLS